MSASPPDIDDRADRIHDRWQAFMLYVDDAFRIAAIGRGYETGRADASMIRGDVTFEVKRPDGEALALIMARRELERISDRHAVEPMSRTQIEAEIAEAIAGRGPRLGYVPRWIGEKNAAAEIAAFVACQFPAPRKKLTDEEASQNEREIRQWLAVNHADKTREQQEIIGAMRYLELTGNAPRWRTPTPDPKAR